MVGIFSVVQDHNQGPWATWDICQKRILNSNHAKFRLSIAYFIFAQSFWNIVHCTAVILTWSVHNIKTCVNWKGCYWPTKFCEFWVRDEFHMNIGLHWTAPLEPNFFSYTVSCISNLVCLGSVLMGCFSYHHCSRIWNPAQFLRYIDVQYYL